MPPQLKTLIPLFGAFIVLFLIARHFLVPVSFGEAGHYRFNSIAENKERAMNYAGKDACADCHEDKAAQIKSDLHAGLSCETCHGPGQAHSQDPESVKLIKPDQRSFCGTCHSMNASRPSFMQQIELKEHYPDKKCIECHNPHQPCQLKE